VLADAVPRRTHLDDVDVAVGDVGLHFEFVPQVLGHALKSPEADAVQISFGERHHISLSSKTRRQHPPVGDSERGLCTQRRIIDPPVGAGARR
jgi:catechol-2,3-dioxygenase